MDVFELKEKMAYSVREAAEQTTLSNAYLRNEIRDGHLKVKRRGRRVIILKDDLLNYLNSGEKNENEK